MKRSKNNPRGKRPNPARDVLAGMGDFMGRTVGPMILSQSVPDATLTELMVLASLLPVALKILRSAGPDAAENALDKLFPEGGEIFPGITLEKPVPADASDPAHSTSPEATK